MTIDLSRPGAGCGEPLEGGGQGIVTGDMVLEVEVAQERTIPVPVRLDLEALAPVDPAYPAVDLRAPLRKLCHRGFELFNRYHVRVSIR
ncbi:hypothetical protein [Pseudomonas oryzihabitans]|uniref:hypothetical protein n=1 Tax=Pseudomonas oryzihabitans TaxID=47885 RepID=UPI001CC2E051|nr:hypothetical protein [Pseudomonas oryzihabitans]